MTRYPFNLDDALAGAPCMTEDGRVVRVTRDARLETLIADDGQRAWFISPDGRRAFEPSPDRPNDLFMAQRTVWLNLYADGSANWHPTKQDAIDAANRVENMFGTKPQLAVARRFYLP